MKERVTIKDVARYADVSPTTVSHVLSGQGRVSTQTRSRVEAAVEELGYQPHPAARTLRTAKFDSIGLLLPHRATSLEFYSDLAMGAAREAFVSGLSITLIPPDASVTAIASMSIDAVVVAEPLTDDGRLPRLCERMPVVLCERADGNLSSVDLGHGTAMGELLDHFIAQGAQRICLLQPPTASWWGRRVGEGVTAWATKHPSSELMVQEMPFVATADEVSACLRRALALQPDALFVAQEGVVPVILGVAKEFGLRVPEDLLVAVGVDARDARYSPLPVTAVDLSAGECGELAVRLTQSESAECFHTEPTLRVRASTLRNH